MPNVVKKPTISQLILLHKQILESENQTFVPLSTYGQSLLESAVNKIDSGFGDYEHYPSFCDKAMALLIGIDHNQPFPDGNKRLALAATYLFFKLNNIIIQQVSQKTLKKFVLSIAQNNINHEQASSCCEQTLK